MLIPYIFLYFGIGLAIMAPIGFMEFTIYMVVLAGFFLWQTKEFMDYVFKEEVKSITKEMRRGLHEI